VSVTDYQSIYPALLYPADRAENEHSRSGIHWAKPGSWKRAADAVDEIAHLQYWTPVTAPYLLRLVKQIRRKGKSVVITAHNPVAHERLRFLEGTELALLRQADHLIVHSDSGKRLLTERMPDRAGEISVIPHGVEIRSHRRRSGRDYELTGLDETRSVVLFFGNIRPYKGLPTLLDAWQRVVEQNDTCDLVIAGRTWSGNSIPAKAVARLLGTASSGVRLRSEIERAKRDKRIHVIGGFVPDEVIDALCRIADVAVFPYERFEAQSGAACRAAGWGVPIIVSDTGALPELVFGPECVIPPLASDVLAARLLEWLGQADRLNAVQESQQRHVERFSWPAIAGMHNRVYKRFAMASE
jgi:glycosyltransferase involved in cell wall biosynthesis